MRERVARQPPRVEDGARAVASRRCRADRAALVFRRGGPGQRAARLGAVARGRRGAPRRERAKRVGVGHRAHAGRAARRPHAPRARPVPRRVRRPRRARGRALRATLARRPDASLGDASLCASRVRAIAGHRRGGRAAAARARARSAETRAVAAGNVIRARARDARAKIRAAARANESVGHARSRLDANGGARSRPPPSQDRSIARGGRGFLLHLRRARHDA
jgi:hypothetical protein